MSLLLSSFLLVSGLIHSGAQAKQKDAIRIQMGGEPSTLDPYRAIDVYGFSVLRNVNEGLFRLDGEGHLQNGLVESYSVSPNQLEYRFKLRPAKWSDGQAVKVDDFVFGLQHLVDPKTIAPNAEYFFAIKNAKEIYSGKKTPAELGVYQDKAELVIQLAKPDPLLPQELSLPAASPLRRDLFKQIWTTDLPVTGDYQITSYKPADEIELKPNPHARIPGKKPVTFKILGEEITAMNLFESGRMDVASTITTSEIADLEQQGLIRKVPSTTVFYISFNMTKAPLSDIVWRKAVASAVEREGLSRALNKTYEPITSVVAKSIAGALPYKPMNDKAAMETVRAIKNKPRLKFAYGASAFTKIVAEKVQDDFEKKLGLKIELEPMELKTLLGRLRTNPPDMYFLGMSAAFDDPFPQLNSFSNASVPNFSRYVSAVFEAQLDQMKQTPLGKKRTELAEIANRTLTEGDVVSVPLLLRTQVYGVSKKLKGFQLSPFAIIQLNQLSKD